MALEVARHLVLSTAHLSKTARAWLDDGEWRDDTGVTYFRSNNILTIPFEYGWIVWCDEDADPDETPGEIRAAILLAKQNGCDWLKYDADGDTIEILPEFEDGTDKLAGQVEVIDCGAPADKPMPVDLAPGNFTDPEA